MKRLHFERAYLLESSPCDRCHGTGRFSRVATNRPTVCYNCRGLGRKITRDGRQLFEAIAELLGKPVIERESRIQPKHLESILGRDVQPGMRVAMVRYRHPLRDVASVSTPGVNDLRIEYTDGYVVHASGIAAFARELTAAELDRVEAMMAQHVGRGAVAAPQGAR